MRMHDWLWDPRVLSAAWEQELKSTYLLLLHAACKFVMVGHFYANILNTQRYVSRKIIRMVFDKKYNVFHFCLPVQRETTGLNSVF